MIELPKRTRPAIDAQINIVPYIDVMLVLLVIFMLATPIIQQGIEVDLPTAEAQAVDFSEHPPIIITIDEKGDYFISSLDLFDDESAELSQGERFLPKTIAKIVKARMEELEQTKVFVKGDKNVPYGKVVEMMSLLQNEGGVGKIGVMTESPDAK